MSDITIIKNAWIVDAESDFYGSIVFSEDESSVVAGIDLKDIVLIKTADAVLACPVKSVAKIKSLLSVFSKDPRFQKYL